MFLDKYVTINEHTCFDQILSLILVLIFHLFFLPESVCVCARGVLVCVFECCVFACVHIFQLFKKSIDVQIGFSLFSFLYYYFRMR